MEKSLELDVSAGELLTQLGRPTSESRAECSLEKTGNSLLLYAYRGAWWRPRIQADVIALSQGTIVSYRFAPEWTLVGLWIVLGIGVAIFGTLGLDMGLEAYQVEGRHALVRQAVYIGLAIYGVLTAWLTFQGMTDARRVETMFLRIFERFPMSPRSSPLAQPIGGESGEFLIESSPEKFFQTLGRVLDHRAGPSHRFVGRVEAPAFSFSVPNLDAMRGCRVYNHFYGSAHRQSDGKTLIRWQFQDPGRQWLDRLGGALLLSALAYWGKVPLWLSLVGSFGLFLLMLPLEHVLILGHQGTLKMEAASLLQWCAQEADRPAPEVRPTI